VIRPSPVAKADARIQTYIDALRVTGIRASGTDSKVLMNDRVFRVNDIVERSLGLRLTGVAADRLSFTDENGLVLHAQFLARPRDGARSPASMLAQARHIRTRLLQIADGLLFTLALTLAYWLRATFPWPACRSSKPSTNTSGCCRSSAYLDRWYWPARGSTNRRGFRRVWSSSCGCCAAARFWCSGSFC